MNGIYSMKNILISIILFCYASNGVFAFTLSLSSKDRLAKDAAHETLRTVYKLTESLLIRGPYYSQVAWKTFRKEQSYSLFLLSNDSGTLRKLGNYFNTYPGMHLDFYFFNFIGWKNFSDDELNLFVKEYLELVQDADGDVSQINAELLDELKVQFICALLLKVRAAFGGFNPSPERIENVRKMARLYLELIDSYIVNLDTEAIVYPDASILYFSCFAFLVIEAHYKNDAEFKALAKRQRYLIPDEVLGPFPFLKPEKDRFGEVYKDLEVPSWSGDLRAQMYARRAFQLEDEIRGLCQLKFGTWDDTSEQCLCGDYVYNPAIEKDTCYRKFLKAWQQLPEDERLTWQDLSFQRVYSWGGKIGSNLVEDLDFEKHLGYDNGGLGGRGLYFSCYPLGSNSFCSLIGDGSFVVGDIDPKTPVLEKENLNSLASFGFSGSSLHQSHLPIVLIKVHGYYPDWLVIKHPIALNSLRLVNGFDLGVKLSDIFSTKTRWCEKVRDCHISTIAKQKKDLRVGVYAIDGDPIHNGHLKIIEKAFTLNLIDFIYVVPFISSGFGKTFPTYSERETLMKYALDEFLPAELRPRALSIPHISDSEFQGPVLRFWDYHELIKAHYRDKKDIKVVSFMSIDTYKHYRQQDGDKTDKVDFIWLNTENLSKTEVIDSLQNDKPENVIPIALGQKDFSSADFRSLLRVYYANADIKVKEELLSQLENFLPRRVIDYIVEREYYRESDS